MVVNLHLQTSSREHKKARTSTELQTYFDSIRKDLLIADEEDLIWGDPLTWWRHVGKARHPILYKMALDYLSIPTTSCECERCFSKARRTITMNRNSLALTTIEALQLQRNWLQRQAVKSELNQLSDHISSQKLSGAGAVGDLGEVTAVTPVTTPISNCTPDK